MRMSPRLMPLPTLLSPTTLLLSESCLDGRKRHPLVTESSPQPVRLLPTLQVKGSTRHPTLARSPALLPYLP
jgi:hypothetical protein